MPVFPLYVSDIFIADFVSEGWRNRAEIIALEFLKFTPRLKDFPEEFMRRVKNRVGKNRFVATKEDGEWLSRARSCAAWYTPAKRKKLPKGVYQSKLPNDAPLIVTIYTEGKRLHIGTFNFRQTAAAGNAYHNYVQLKRLNPDMDHDTLRKYAVSYALYGKKIDGRSGKPVQSTGGSNGARMPREQGKVILKEKGIKKNVHTKASRAAGKPPPPVPTILEVNGFIKSGRYGIPKRLRLS